MCLDADDEFWGIENSNKKRLRCKWQVDGRIAARLIDLLEDDPEQFQIRWNENYITDDRSIEVSYKQAYNSTVVNLFVAPFVTFHDIHKRIEQYFDKIGVSYRHIPKSKPILERICPRKRLCKGLRNYVTV